MPTAARRAAEADRALEAQTDGKIYVDKISDEPIPLEAIEAEYRRKVSLKNANIDSQSLDAIRARCTTLIGFVREAWHVVEPTETYVEGWVIEAICAHLEAVSRGEIIRLLINVPPGMMKSMLVSVLWPAWEWGPLGRPSLRYLSTSYREDYAARDSRRMRDLVQSPWYQSLWPRTALVRDAETSFANVATGWREAMPFKSLTGGRGHRLLIDDPHSIETAESDADLARTTRTFREAAGSRMVDPRSSAIVLIMQRLRTTDLSAVALQFGYVHLMLPMEFEPDRKCYTAVHWRKTPENPDGEPFEDPRTEKDELLFPERFPREVVERDRKFMGSFAHAGQFQQRPTLREGGLFKRHWFKLIEAYPVGVRWCRHWDLAATEDQVSSSKTAYTAGVLLGRTATGRFIVADVVRERAEGQGVRQLIKNTAAQDKMKYGHVEISLPQDPGQAGKTQAKDMVLMLAGYVVHAGVETGSKVTRAAPVASQAEAGNIDILNDPLWTDDFLEELANFPGSPIRDQVDGLSGAFAQLIGNTVYSTSEVEFAVETAYVPSVWGRIGAIAMDAHNVAVVWGAYSRQTDVVYLYEEYVAPRRDFAIHADALRKRGDWIPFVFDLEGKKRTREEGARIAMRLLDLKVDVLEARVDVAASIDEVSTRLATGRLRVFTSMTNWLTEYRRFSRDEKGEVIQQDDLLMQATLALVGNGIGVSITENAANSDRAGYDLTEDTRNPVTGY